jgi:hypothetical protein
MQGDFMSLKVFLRVLAVWAAGLGLVWILTPQTGLNNDPSPYALLVGRVLGSDLLVIGLMTWLASNQNAGLQYLFLWPNVFVHATPAVLTLANILSGSFPASQWGGFIVHIIPLVGCVIYLAVKRPN